MEMGLLSPREREFAEKLGQGKDFLQAAQEMCITQRTAWEYAYRVRRKLAVASTIELVARVAVHLAALN